MLTLTTAIAANRFGIGARPGDAGRIGDDPAGWLESQIGPAAAQPSAGTRPDSAEVLTEVRDLRLVRQAAQQAAQAAQTRQGDQTRPGNQQQPGVDPAAIREFAQTIGEHYQAQAGALYATAIASDAPFRERLALFWANHFAVSAEKQPIGAIAGLYIDEAIRPNLVGNFRDLLRAAIQHPAMLLYLDNHTSIGPGSLLGSRYAARVRRPAALFLGLQAAVGLSCSALLVIIVFAATRLDAMRNHFSSEGWLSLGTAFRGLRATLGGGLQGNFEVAPLVPELILVYILLPALMVIPATFLMGFSFPILQRVVHTDLASIGRRVGTLLMANVVGSTAGAMLTGWLLLDLIGTAGTFRLLTVVGGIFGLCAMLMSARSSEGVLAFRERAHSSLGLAGAGLVAALLALALVAVVPGQRTLWAAVHGTDPADMILAEDGSGVSVLKTKQPGYDGKVVVFVNGLSQSTIPYGGIHSALGALPIMIHPDPRDIAVIGLGSGDTAYSVAGWPETERIVCVEIIRPQLETLEALNPVRGDPGLRGLLADRRITHVFGDGRAYLLRGGRLYDIIEADALRPRSAYAGNLYSEEYFMLLRDRLKPGGLAATWVPTPRVRAAFMKVFPHVMEMSDIFIGSTRPIVFDRVAVQARLSDPRVRSHYESAGVDIDALLSTYLDAPLFHGPDDPRDNHAEVNTDLFPRDEFDIRPVTSPKAAASAGRP